MNKKLIIILIFLIGIIYMPIVNAKELPREGVTYFITYPNGEETVTNNYDEAISSKETEKLIFEGKTDANGQVILEDIGDVGELRIVQSVPNGYTTAEKEIVVNLKDKQEATMTNSLGFVNPKTGVSILVILLVVGGVTFITIKTKKKELLIIPLIAVISLVNVKAESDNFVLTVKDNFGSTMSGVAIKIYAKPLKVEAYPAIKFDANGGVFFDGTTEMYMKLPYNGCSFNEMYNFNYDLDEYNARYIDDNYYGAYKDGYYRGYTEEPNTLSNGDVIRIDWIEDNNSRILTIHGNGGTYDFYGKKLDSISFYNYIFSIYQEVDSFKKQNEEINGFSINASCTNPQYEFEENPNELYICWTSNKDGIYLNDHFYSGNTNDCFNKHNTASVGDSYFSVASYGEKPGFNIAMQDENLYIMYPFSKWMDLADEKLRSIKIVKDGETILDVKENEIIQGDTAIEYLINNSEKKEIFKQYLQSIRNASLNRQCPNRCYFVVCAE